MPILFSVQGVGSLLQTVCFLDPLKSMTKFPMTSKLVKFSTASAVAALVNGSVDNEPYFSACIGTCSWYVKVAL